VIRTANASGSQTGTALLNRPVQLTPDLSFSTAFSFRLSNGNAPDCCGDANGADGLSFVMSQDIRGPLAIGDGGGTMGLVGGIVSGDQPTNVNPALIVELDTWHQGSYDGAANTNVNGSHIGVNLSTSRTSIAQTGPLFAGDPVVISQLNDGNVKHVWVDYDGNLKVMQVFFSDTNVKPAAPVIYKQVNLSRLFNSNQVYLGFAGATGGAWNNHDVRTWSFDSQPSPNPPAENFAYGAFYPDFSDVSLFTMNGTTAPTSVDGRLRLTESVASQGVSAVLTDPVILRSDFSFRTKFDFEVSMPGGAADPDGLGADGFTFFLATGPRGARIVGSVGGGLGLDTISANFVAIEFDTWNSGAFDPNTTLPTHIGIDSSNNAAIAPGSVNRIAVPRFNDGGIHRVWVEYDGLTKTMNVYYSDTSLVKPASPTLTATIDVGAILGQTNDEVFLGFSAGTGGATNRHDILNWEFVPEPSSYVLAMFGLVALAGLARRRRKA
jgi:hypothetical protein